MHIFFTIIVVATLSEAIWEILKKLIPVIDDRIWSYLNLVGSLAVSVFVGVATGVDIFHLLGIDLKWPVVGVVLTGIIISRGSNFIHDLVTRLQSSSKNG